jgi:hypothetical protein
MLSLFRSKQTRVDEPPLAERTPTPDEKTGWRARYAASKEKLEAALESVEGIAGDLKAMGLTLKADRLDAKVCWDDPKAPWRNNSFAIALSDVGAFCRLIRHINTAPPTFITDAQEMVGEELAAFGVAIALTAPNGFTVTQDGAEDATRTVECAADAVFLAMTLALRRALQERQAAQEPAAGAQIISFAAEQARRQGDDETF